MSTSTDLAKFGAREREMAEELLKTWREDGLPGDFEDDKVIIVFNLDSGRVFLSNSDFQVAMMNGDELESWYSCPQCGHEGFLDEMKHNPDDDECTKYLYDIGAIKRFPEEK